MMPKKRRWSRAHEYRAVAILGFVALFALMLLRVPVGMAMGLVGVTGFGYLVGFTPALKMVGQTSMRTVTDYTFGVIPMFLLMGAFVSDSGMSRELFRAANGFVGHLRGAFGIATVGLRRLCGDLRLVGGDGRDVFRRRLSRNAVVSPMIGVTPAARLASIISLLGPLVPKARWIDIVPEYNPFKYNSFPANAGAADLAIDGCTQQPAVARAGTAGCWRKCRRCSRSSRSSIPR